MGPTRDEFEVLVMLGHGPIRDELDVLKLLLVSHRLVGGSCWTIGSNGVVAIITGGDCEIPSPTRLTTVSIDLQ